MKHLLVLFLVVSILACRRPASAPAHTCPCRNTPQPSAKTDDRSTPPPTSGQKQLEPDAPPAEVPSGWMPALPLYQDSEQVPAELAAMVEGIRNAQGAQRSVAFSSALSQLATHILAYGGKPIAPLTLVEMAGQWGIASPWILQNTLVSAGYDLQALAAWAARNIATYRTQHGVTHFGIAMGKRADGSDLVVLLMQRRRFSHAPFPRWVTLGQAFTMTGRMESGVTQLEVLVTAPDGKVTRARVPLNEDLSFALRLDFCAKEANRGHYNVELLGKDAHGPFVAGLFPVACGQEAAVRRLETRFQEATGEIAPDAFADAVFGRVNQHREKLGLPAFRTDARLAAIAKAHSEEMCAQKKIFHVSPTTGSPLERVQRARLNVQLVAENVAMGATPEEIVGAWDKSEGHRLNMEHAKGTHAGVGVCRGLYGTDTVVYYITLLIVAY